MHKYGSLEIFSTQGMEKSHYRAKGVYFKNTRHGGGAMQSNYLEEMFNWFFRSTFARKLKQERARQSKIAMEVRRLQHETACTKWRNSTGPANHAAWRQHRVRVGSRWTERLS